MEQNQDFFETWVKSQNDFFNTWMESQEKFVENWTDSVTDLQNSFIETAKSQNISGSDRYYPEYLNWLYSPTSMNEEFTNNQKLLKTTFQKQLDLFKEMLQASVDSFTKSDK